MCDVCAQLPKIKSSHPKPKKYHIAKQQQNNSNQTAHLTITHPLIPSLEGNPTHHKPLITNKNAASQTSPLERGWGCVTYAHSHPNQKHPLKANRYHLKKLLKPNRAPHHNTPLNSLSRGESYIPQTTHYQQEHSIPNLPSREGPGVCHARAEPPKIKSSHRNSTDTSAPNSSKNTSSQTALLTITHPSIPSQEGNNTRHKSLITNKKNSIPNLPSREGTGVCHAQAQPPKSKITTQSQETPPQKTPQTKPRISS